MPQRDVQPAFEVEELDGNVEETYYERDNDLKMNVEKKRNVPAGWMVYFPNGNSIRVRTWDDMKRLGFNRQPGLVDMESGETYEEPQRVSLKARVASSARGKQRRADTTSVEAQQGDE